MGSPKRFDIHHGKPQGPNGGNVIDLSKTPEGTRVINTCIGLGHTMLGGAVAGTEATALDGGEVADSGYDPAKYKKDIKF